MNANDAKKLTKEFLSKYDDSTKIRISIDRINIKIEEAAKQGYTEITVGIYQYAEACNLEKYFKSEGFNAVKFISGNDGDRHPTDFYSLNINWR
jgi:hypothetical protein